MEMFNRSEIMKKAHKMAKMKSVRKAYRVRLAEAMRFYWKEAKKAVAEAQTQQKTQTVVTKRIHHRCEECGRVAVTTKRDTSGIVGHVCSRCAKTPSYQLSFA